MNTYINPFRAYDNEAELDAYVGFVAEAADLLAQLTEFVENYGNVAPDNVDQNEVSRMKAIVIFLRNAKTIAGIDG